MKRWLVVWITLRSAFSCASANANPPYHQEGVIALAVAPGKQPPYWCCRQPRDCVAAKVMHERQDDGSRSPSYSHVDMMFHASCVLGHGVGLDAAARGMGVAGKPEGMKGDLAPALWAKGKREEVLRYVAQDVRITLGLATACEALGELRWVSRSGMVRSMALLEGWLAVSEARELPLPDTTWMMDPWPRERFTGWMG